MLTKNKIIGIVSVVAILIVSCFFMLRKDSFDKKVSDVLEEVSSYQLKGDMEINKGEDIKGYDLEVGYQKKDEKDYFRVSITDKELNQTQEILRNDSGVYVVTPSLNQVFKFEGNWPLNSLKPYLIQSMVEIIESDTTEVVSQKDGFLVTSDVNYPNNANFKKQEMLFDKQGKIKWLRIRDDHEIEQLKIVFKDVNYDKKMKKNYFDVPVKMSGEVGVEVISEEDLPLYPMQIFDSALESTSSVEVAQGVSHVLEYRGDKNFTVIEKKKEKSEQLQTVIMNGELVDQLDAFGFYDGNHMVMISQGIEYTIYSDDLTPMQMAEVLSSMQVAVMK